MRKSLRWVLAFAFVLMTAPVAFAGADFSHTVCFGDSLTHNELLGAVYDNPQDMYGMDPAEAVYSKGRASGDKLNGYGVASSKSEHLAEQITAYEIAILLDAQDRATFINFEIGGNDILDEVNILAANPPGSNSAADGVIDDLKENIRESWNELRDTHPDTQFMIWTIPDVTATPKLWGSLTTKEVENVRAHIYRVNRMIRGFAGPSVLVFDLYKWMKSRVVNPPVIYGHQLVPPPDYSGYDYLFADRIHPTAVSNALMANSMINAINKKWNDTIPLYTRKRLATLAHIVP